MSDGDYTGTIKWFNADKGYGFIEPDQGEDDVFFHYSALEEKTGFKTIDEDARVSFTQDSGEDGLFAPEVYEIDG
jgi:CspA family cold shock protein